jgi:hypothetical protein
MDRNKLVFLLNAQVVEKLRRRWSVRLEIPRFVEHRVVTGLHDTGRDIEIHYVLVGGGVSEKDLCEIMVVEFTLSCARLSNTHP